jgi:hypothetical protein
MGLLTAEQRNALFDSLERDAFHLELRDAYYVDSEDESYRRWKLGKPQDPRELERPWLRRMRRLIKSGKTIRRVRVVTEPLSEYIRFEYDCTPENLAAGEDIRWLPRQLVPEDVTFPLEGRDWWLFDDSLIAAGHFDEQGRSLGSEISRDPGLVRQCVSVRDRLWQVAVPHGDYRPS